MCATNAYVRTKFHGVFSICTTWSMAAIIFAVPFSLSARSAATAMEAERSEVVSSAIARAQADVKSRLSYPGSARFFDVMTAFAPEGAEAPGGTVAVCGWVRVVANSGKEGRTRFISLQRFPAERNWHYEQNIADIKHALKYVDDGFAESVGFERYWNACMHLSVDQQKTVHRIR